MKNFLILACSVFLLSYASAKDVPSVSPVVDQAGLLSAQVRQKITSALISVKQQTTNEIAVLTIKSLEDESIDGYALKVSEAWKLGQKGKDNGILFLISLEDRKMRIEVGSGLEGDLPDITAGRIIRSTQPYFKKGDYSSGIILALSQIIDKTGGTLKGAPRVRNRRSSRSSSSLLFFAIIFLSMIFGRGGRGRGGSILTGMLLGSMIGGRSSGGFGGGGFSGGGGFGGGGGFSGGGASGGW